MYEVILENATGRISIQFDDVIQAQKFCYAFAKSHPEHGDRRNYRIYNSKGKMIDHEEFA